MLGTSSRTNDVVTADAGFFAVKKVIETIRVWWRRARSRRELMALNTRELWEMRLTRGRRHARGPQIVLDGIANKERHMPITVPLVLRGASAELQRDPSPVMSLASRSTPVRGDKAFWIALAILSAMTVAFASMLPPAPPDRAGTATPQWITGL
jgi:uncharacterized protein YjiS (DUF1127 family)